MGLFGNGSGIGVAYQCRHLRRVHFRMREKRIRVETQRDAPDHTPQYLTLDAVNIRLVIDEFARLHPPFGIGGNERVFVRSLTGAFGDANNHLLSLATFPPVSVCRTGQSNCSSLELPAIARAG